MRAMTQVENFKHFLLLVTSKTVGGETVTKFGTCIVNSLSLVRKI